MTVDDLDVLGVHLNLCHTYLCPPSEVSQQVDGAVDDVRRAISALQALVGSESDQSLEGLVWVAFNRAEPPVSTASQHLRDGVVRLQACVDLLARDANLGGRAEEAAEAILGCLHQPATTTRANRPAVCARCEARLCTATSTVSQTSCGARAVILGRFTHCTPHALADIARNREDREAGPGSP